LVAVKVGQKVVWRVDMKVFSQVVESVVEKVGMLAVYLVLL